MTVEIQQMPVLKFPGQRKAESTWASGSAGRAPYLDTDPGHDIEHLKPNMSLAATPVRSAAVANDGPVIDATPLKNFTENSTSDFGFIPASSPLQARRCDPQMKDVTDQRFKGLYPLRTPTKRDKVDATPINPNEDTANKQTSAGRLLMSPESSCRKSSHELGSLGSPDIGVAKDKDESIYKTLGWDDDDDIDELL